MGAAGTDTDTGPSDDQFNRVSFLSHFEGANNGVNNAFDDGSASNHTISATGEITQGSFGPFARPDGEFGVSFNGSDNRLRTNASNLDITTEAFTAEAWIFPVSSMDQYDIIVCLFAASHGNNANQTWSIRAGTSNTIEIVTIASGTQTIQSAGTANINAWNHVAISRNGTTMYAALNGAVTSKSCASSLNGHEYFYIGASDANGSGAYFFNGVISNVRYEIGNARYTSNYTVPTSKLTATTNTKILTCQSSRFVDNSTSNNTFLRSGIPAVTAFGPFLTSSVYDAAVNGASAYFDGDNDYLQAANTADFDLANGNFTWECQAYIHDISPQNAQWFFSVFTTSSGDNAWGLRLEANGTLNAYFSGDGGESPTTIGVAAASSGLTENAWHHIAVVKNGTGNNNIKVYVDGVSKVTGTFGAIKNTSLPFTVGRQMNNSYPQYFLGYISDVRIIKGTAVYTGNFTPPTAPLTAITNTKMLLNMANGQAIDSAAQNNLTFFADSKISTSQKKIGNSSLYVDGSGDYVSFPNTPFGTGDFTVECWVRCLGSTYDKGIWDNHTASGSSDGLTLTRIAAAQFRLFGTGELIRSGNFTITNTWVNVTVVRSSGTLNLFVNGVSQGTTGFTANLNSASDFLIGGGRYTSGGPSSGSLNAYIDEFRTSHFARYTSNFTPSTEPFADKGK